MILQKMNLLRCQKNRWAYSLGKYIKEFMMAEKPNKQTAVMYGVAL